MQVLVNEKPLMTPGRLPLEVPTKLLADAIAEEWADGFKAGYEGKMLTSLASTAIDRIPQCRDVVITQLARICENDQLLSWVDQPDDLVQMQEVQWRPLIQAVNKQLDLDLKHRIDLSIPAMPSVVEVRLMQWCECMDNFQLAGFSYMVELCHSFVLSYCLVSGELADPLQAWEIAELHENYQAKRWGNDAEAAERSIKIRDDFVKSVQFFQLCK